MQVFQLVDEHAMAVPVGGANEDGDGGINHDAHESVAEHEYCAMAGLGGTTHGSGNGADRLAAKPTDRNRSYLIPIVTNLG
jgi:hypothetical protein